MKARPAMAHPPKTRAAPASPAPSRRLHFKQPDVNAGSAPSSPVFVNESGSPMIFYVPPCSSGGELRRLITAGGGKVSEKAGKNVINLMPEGLKHKKLQKLEDAISSSFVVDCMSRKTLLPLSSYRLGAAPQAAGSAASAPSRAPAKASPAHAARGQKREKFTREDDAALVEWVRKNPDLKSQGKDIWVRAANAKVTHHSWQSMQNRYRRQLKEKKGDGLRRAMACGAAAQGPTAAPAAPSKASENGAAPVVVVDDDLIEDFSQTRAPKRKAEAPQASIERKTSMRTSLSTWKRRKERQRAAAMTPVEAAPAYQPPTALATAMAQASPRISVPPTPDIFRGVPQWILDTQDLEKPADISLLL